LTSLIFFWKRIPIIHYSVRSFTITIYCNYRLLNYSVEEIYRDARIERFIVHGRDRSITLESNRPFFLNKGIKKRQPDWKVIYGQVAVMHPLELMIEQILKKLEPK
jgi:hypothetical protein